MNWTPAQKALDAFTKSARDGAAHAVRCGLELLRLRAEVGISRGGDRRSNPHAAGLIPNWADLVARELGISDDTAQRWMRAARGYLLGVCGRKDERWWLENKAVQKALFAQLAQLAAKATLRDLASEWNRLMCAASAPETIGNGGGLDPVPQLAPALELAAMRTLAAQQFEAAIGSIGALDYGMGDMPFFAILDKACVEQQVADLQRAISLRQAMVRGGDKALRARIAEIRSEIEGDDELLARMENQRQQAETLRKAALRRAAKQAAQKGAEAIA